MLYVSKLIYSIHKREAHDAHVDLLVNRHQTES